MGFSPRSIVRRMPTVFPATLITIPSVYVMPYAAPLRGRLARNVLALQRCSPRRRATSMMVILLGPGVHTLQSSNYTYSRDLGHDHSYELFHPTSLLLCFASLPKDRSSLRPLR